MFDGVRKAIGIYDTIVIHRHRNPDGDAIGSQIGLKHILRANFPGKRIFAVGDSAPRFSFLSGSEMDEISDEEYSGALAFVLDTSSPALISDSRYTLAAETVRIDHHLFLEQICHTEVVDPGFESCCGLIAAFAEACSLEIPREAAEALYTGMVTDSGRFRFDSVSARTFRLAAMLCEQGIDRGRIYTALYSDDYERMKMRASFILKIRFTEHRVAYLYTTEEEVEALGTDAFSLSRGMVNTMADIRGTDIWCNFTEDKGGVLCELRSSRYNINPIAVRYGGGGHAKASGATLPDRGTAMRMLAELDQLSAEEGNG